MTKQSMGKVALLLWAPSTLCLVAFLMVDHVAPLPPPGDPASIRSAVANRWGDVAGPGATHVIYEQCSCTDRLFDHLLARGPRSGWHERVLYVGTESSRPASARARGFATMVVSREQLRREWAIDGAPVLVLTDAAGEVTYAGGYFRFPAALHPRDVPLMEQVADGAEPRELPVFGCAVDERIARQRDPFGFRAWR